ncbi:MAG: WbqC family protein [Candidatus Pacebacteria bacterium]|nr:WbqC family protein [Candidatus Paceibacterota bacterium]
MKKIAILQSNYIPWKGYFDMIAAVDEFIIYDDMQYTRRDWRNRNLINTKNGLVWLTIPVANKGQYEQKIRETLVSEPDWAKKHWRSIELTYARARHFTEIAEWLAPLYLNQTETNLSLINRQFIDAICNYLGIKTVIKNSWDYQLIEGKTERLADLCVQAGGGVYISGPAAKDYIDESIFTGHRIELIWFDYSGYAEYPQLQSEFIHGVSILDLLFNCGQDSRSYMKFLK